MAPDTGGKTVMEKPSAKRFVMYFFFFMTCTLHFLVREMAPSLVGFIADEFGWTLQQKGVLLGSYFPGYIIGQVPSAVLAEKIGGKLTLTLANFGTVLCMLATPAAKSVRMASLVMNFLGLMGGAMFPVSGMLKKLWLPESLAPTERAFALRVTTWGVNIGRFFTATLTPLLALRFGWRAVPLMYGAAVAGFAVPFHMFAANSPTEWAMRGSGWMAKMEQKLLGVDLTKGDTYVLYDKAATKCQRAFPCKIPTVLY
jgi:MFS family permease